MCWLLWSAIHTTDFIAIVMPLWTLFYQKTYNSFLDCGRYISKWERPTFGTKNKIENIEFPWHALIYEFDPLTGGYDQRCAGTLISTNIVISAADCYVKKNSREPKIPLKDFSTFKVALGKFYSNINNTEDDFAQIRDVSSRFTIQ